MGSRERGCMTVEGGFEIDSTALACLLSKLRTAKNTGKNTIRRTAAHFNLHQAFHSEVWRLELISSATSGGGRQAISVAADPRQSARADRTAREGHSRLGWRSLATGAPGNADQLELD